MNDYRFSVGQTTGLCFTVRAPSLLAAVRIAREEFTRYEQGIRFTWANERIQELDFYPHPADITEDSVIGWEPVKEHVRCGSSGIS